MVNTPSGLSVLISNDCSGKVSFIIDFLISGSVGKPASKSPSSDTSHGQGSVYAQRTAIPRITPDIAKPISTRAIHTLRMRSENNKRLQLRPLRFGCRGQMPDIVEEMRPVICLERERGFPADIES